MLGSTLVLAAGARLDFESQPLLNITVSVRDFENGLYSMNQTVFVTNVNEAPTNLSLTGNVVVEVRADLLERSLRDG